VGVARLLEEHAGAEDRCLQEEAKGVARYPPEDVARYLLEEVVEEDEAYLQGGDAEIVHSRLEEEGAHVGVAACLLIEAIPCLLENADQIVALFPHRAEVARFLLEGNAGIIVGSLCLLLEIDAEVAEEILSLLLEGGVEIGMFHFHQDVGVVVDMGVMTVLSP